MSTYLMNASVPVLRSALKTAFASGRDGSPWREAPPSVTAALKRYFAHVDPATYNGASRVRFVWAFTMTRVADYHASNATEHFVVAYFWAHGDSMVAAGAMAPGFNSELMRLSRSSPAQQWQVDGSYSPW
jgi:hypothetical protein